MQIVKTYLNFGLMAFLFGIFFSNAVLHFAVALLFLPAVYILFRNILRAEIEWIDLAVVLFLVSGLISFTISPGTMQAYPKLMHHLSLFTVIAVGFAVANAKKLTIGAFVQFSVLAGSITAMAGIVNYMRDPFRAFGFFAGPYSLANIMVLSLPLTLGWLLQGKINRWQRYFGICGALLQATSLWLTYTRSSLLGLCIGFGVGILILYFSRATQVQLRASRALIYYAIFLSLIAGGMLASEDIRFNPGSFFSHEIREQIDLSSGRIQIIKDAFELQLSNVESGNWQQILFGHGLKSRQMLYKNYTGSWESDYLEVFMNQGLVGLVLVCWLYLLLFLRINRYWQNCPPKTDFPLFLTMTVAVVAYWIMSFFTLEISGFNASAHFVIFYSLFKDV